MSEIWPLYVLRTGAEDKETVQAWNTDLDSILIFVRLIRWMQAALFSSALTTFIIESYRNLQPDPTSVLLQAILVELMMTRDPATAPSTLVQQFKVAASAVRVNVYWFTSLILSLSTALIAILAKQWVNYLLAGLSPVPSSRARHRQYRMDGMRRWNLPAVLSFLPVLLHISLLLFFTGLVDFIWGLNDTVAIISAVLVCITAFVYFLANLL
ncbi:uncharacterized protein TRAVEDRAFT_128690, partial [Trametes versicolor FP-101664 SS1]|uniref:uncharacterized protein n=1 Tax=Trametes versicolor (strain FP-101664) TaxID=717944 RepID=UPI0004624743